MIRERGRSHATSTTTRRSARCPSAGLCPRSTTRSARVRTTRTRRDCSASTSGCPRRWGPTPRSAWWRPLTRGNCLSNHGASLARRTPLRVRGTDRRLSAASGTSTEQRIEDQRAFGGHGVAAHARGPHIANGDRPGPASATTGAGVQSSSVPHGTDQIHRPDGWTIRSDDGSAEALRAHDRDHRSGRQCADSRLHASHRLAALAELGFHVA